MKTPFQQHSKAFTLIELLVVVTIIAILVGLSVPAVSGGIMRAKQSKCASNMRQIGIAMMTYAGEHDYRLPETSVSTSLGNTWIDLLAPYLSDLDEIRICPADPLGNERLLAGGTSYILNSFLFVPERDRRGRVLGPPPNLLQIQNSSETIMAFIISEDQSIGLSSDHTHSETWSSWNAVTADISPDRFTSSSQPDHSVGSANYLYADGHVQSVTASIMKARIDGGENIALPQ
ncbi:MAG: type II secretion system protein [Verrucomicrobiota bacterium]